MKQMNRVIRSIIFSLLLLMTGTIAQADSISYSYDANGNRVTLLNNGMNRSNPTDESERKPGSESLGQHRVTIYPNPTDGRISVEITGTGSLEESAITVYGIMGNMVYNDSEIDVENEIDLTTCPDGMYILIIKIGSDIGIWKIIKI